MVRFFTLKRETIVASLLFSVCALLPCTAFAQGAGYGALKGLADALDEISSEQIAHERELELARQRAAIEIAKEKELQRIRQQAHQDNLAREEQKRSHSSEKRAETEEAQLIEHAHPGWRSIVRTATFRDWHRIQSPSIQQLASSPRSADAIRMLDKYKVDVRRAGEESAPMGGTQMSPAQNEAMVERAHPGWRFLVRTVDWRSWLAGQDASTLQMVNSPRAEDAILVLDLYKKALQGAP